MDSSVFLKDVLTVDVLVVCWLFGGYLVRLAAVVTDRVGTVATGVTDYRRRDLTVTQSTRSVVTIWWSPPFGRGRWLGRSQAATAYHPTCLRNVSEAFV